MKTLAQLFAETRVTVVGSYIATPGEKTVITFDDEQHLAENNSTDARLKSLLEGAIASVQKPMFEVHGNTVFPMLPSVAENMDFSQALAAMKASYPVARAAWHEKKLYVRAGILASTKTAMRAEIKLLLVDFNLVPKNTGVGLYSPTAEDVMAEDWEILTPEYLLAESKKLEKQSPKQPPEETA